MPGGTICPECGAVLPSGVLQGLCPACLLKQGTATPAVPFEPPSVEEIKRLFPQLEIIGLLGKGGMGAVYKARQPALDRFVALKILPPTAAEGPGFSERFSREARALARLNHANIVAVHDFGRVDGFAFFVMEYVDGLNLRQLEQAGRLSPREALQIVPQICAALQFAHDEGIVHRDIKPENILIDKKGRVKIADFGIAKIMGHEAGVGVTETKHTIGTPHYMAPEQVEKPETVDHRADIYSLGVVFYEMLTGELPLGKFAPPSRKVEVDVRLDEVVLHALEKEPERRYQQANEVKTDVETIGASTHKAKTMNTQTVKPLWYQFAVRAIWAFLGLAILFVALVVGWYFMAKERSPARITSGADAVAQEGWQLWQARQLDKAIEKFKEAVKLAPGNANAWNGLGWASFNSGKAQEAEEAFQKAVALEPNHPAALNGLGQIYLSQKKYDLAETFLRKAAPQAPAAWYGLARLYLIQGKFEQAEEWAGKVVDSGQGDEVARKMLEAAKARKLSEGLRFMIEPR
jgi:tetratricopeptide (TPR) repeat protein/predicted Ser/Thr protein kinase